MWEDGNWTKIIKGREGGGSGGVRSMIMWHNNNGWRISFFLFLFF